MKGSFGKAGLSLVMILMSSSIGFANGFLIYGHGARAMAQANAFAARACDPSAVWFNPAGITQLAGSHVYLGGSGFIHNQEFSSDRTQGTYTSDNGFLLSPNIYFTQQFSQRVWLGIGFHTTANFYQNWGDTPTDENPVPQHLSHIRTCTHTLSPAVGVKLSENISLGLGIHYAFSALRVRKWDADGVAELLYERTGLTTSRVELSSETEGSGNALSYFAGLNWQITPKIRFGVSYHRASDLNFGAKMDFELPTIGNSVLDADLAAIFPDQDINTSFQNWVDQLSVGVSFCLGTKLDLEGDLVFNFWSQLDPWEFKDIYPLTVLGMTRYPGTSVELDWSWTDTMSLRLGGEYHASNSLDIRLGVLYDPSPIPPENLRILAPLSNRIGISTGLGYKIDNLSIDLGYMLFSASEMEETCPSQYFYDMHLHGATGHVLSLSAGWAF
jgi:long-chain fatty acid transport protein